MDNIIGLDVSLTSTGMATWDSESNVFTRPDQFPSSMERYDYILNMIMLEISSVWNDVGDPPCVMIEGYAFAKRSSHAHAQGELGGIIRRELWMKEIPYVEVPPNNLKQFATGKGNASKADVISAVTLKTGREWIGKGAEDRVDAWVLRQMAKTNLIPEYDWPKQNLKALEKVDFSPFLD